MKEVREMLGHIILMQLLVAAVLVDRVANQE